MIITSRRRLVPSDPTRYPLPPATDAAPYEFITPCAIATPDGQGQTIHPSVIDLLVERGAPLSGYRWWMANTPWTNHQDITENPIILVSNDRINWTAPPGLTNPIEPWDGVAGNYNGDVELVWDPVAQQLVCFWRWVSEGLGATELRAKTSPDGVVWSSTVLVRSGSPVSPGITRGPSGSWLMLGFGGWGGFLQAVSPLGPWTARPGGAAPAPIVDNPYHGAFKYLPSLGRYVAVFSDRDSIGAWTHFDLYVTTSLDAYTWSPLVKVAAEGGLISTAYRPTIAASTKPGWIDLWCSTAGQLGGVGAGTQVAYTRFPLSALPTA